MPSFGPTTKFCFFCWASMTTKGLRAGTGTLCASNTSWFDRCFQMYRRTWISLLLIPFFSAVLLFLVLNPISTRAGGGGHCHPPPPPPPPPKYTSSNIPRTPWAMDLKLHELIFKAKKIIQPLPPTLGYHSNVQSWDMFLRNTFRQFSYKSSPELDFFFCSFHEE